ncbi:MAG: GAF domain-containing protein [Anaerolineae bacterium]|nr:GAF domain-containing protein [Anaerolineae bacterium]
MNSIQSTLTKLTTLRTTYDDLIAQRQAQRLLLVNLAWITIVLAFIPLLIWWALDKPIDAATPYIPVTLLIGLIIHQHLHTGQLERARWLFVINIASASLLATFPEYRVDSPMIVLLLLPLTAAGVLLQRQGLITLSIVLIGLVILGGVVQLASDMEPTPFPSDEASIMTTLLVLTTVSVLTTALLWIFSGTTTAVASQRQQTVQLLQVMTQISQTLNRLPAASEEVHHAVEQLRNILSLYHVQVFGINPDTGKVELRASTGFIGRRLLEEENLSTPGQQSPIHTIARQTEVVHLRDTDSAVERATFLPATRSELLIPLYIGDQLPLGVLDLHSTDPDTFTGDLVDVLATIGHQLALALHIIQQTHLLDINQAEHTQLRAQIETNQHELERLNRQIVWHTWGEYLPEQHDSALGYEWRDNTVRPARPDTDTLNQALLDGQPHLEQRSGVSVLSVPIRLRGQTLGALEFRRAEAQGWTSAALDMAQAVADRLALSLENARLFEQTQIVADRERLVGQVATQLQSPSDLPALLALAATQFQEALGATRTQVRLGMFTDSTSQEADQE